MFETLGIVTNIWEKRMTGGARFEELARQFSDNGFKCMEVRDGAYLRRCAFGSLIGEIEAAMSHYTDDQWQAICEGIWHADNRRNQIRATDSSLFDRVSGFLDGIKDVVLSYAMSHPWLSKNEDAEADSQRIIQAKKLAYLLCPHAARLRLVDLASEEPIDAQVAVGNLRRYRSLLPDYPMTFAVENARQSATFTLELAVQGGALLTYDEANTYREDGMPLNPPETFWDAVKMDNLTSVHFKQKTVDGVLSQVREGFVDFGAIARRIQAGNYTGDTLLENTPTDQPLEDAIQSRLYLLSLL